MNNVRSTLATVWRIAVPYFRSEDKFAGRLLLAAVIAIELTVVGINVLLNQWNNRFYTALQDKSWDAFVREIVELASPQAAAAGIRVAVKQDIEATSIRVDVDLMKQAILNIVVNAFEAMPDGGELRIECAMYNDEAEIRISDTGTGIPPELREKIFRLYYTTKPEGSGIGLAMTFRIVQLHDGAIDFTSEPGNGTTFVLRLPISL